MAALALLSLPVPAGAAETHLFSAPHSLTGDCSVSATDPVPDPGCPAGTHPPAGQFTLPFAEAVDLYGDLYVSSLGSPDGTAAHIDIFGPSGHFITEIARPGLMRVAVDPEGRVYAFEKPKGQAFPNLIRFDPETYEPSAGKIEYETTPTTVLPGSYDGIGDALGIAVDPSDGHLYVVEGFPSRVVEYGSAAEGNAPLAAIGSGSLFHPRWLAVDGRNHDLYVSDTSTKDLESNEVVRVFSGSGSHSLLRSIAGFETSVAEASVAVEEGNGHLFVGVMGPPSPRARIYELPEGATGVAEAFSPPIEHQIGFVPVSSIAVDNGTHPSANPGMLYVPSEKSGEGHEFAFEPIKPTEPPVVEALTIANVTEAEAEVAARVDPGNAATTYSLQAVTLAAFETEGFAGAPAFAEGQLPAANEGQPISALLPGLLPETAYVVRAVAESHCHPGEPEVSCVGERLVEFTTYPAPPSAASCPNQALRVGLSANLPDCRAYELVTPADTGGHIPKGGGFVGSAFPTLEASSSGDSVAYVSEGGVIPGYEGTGSLNGDPYVAARTPTGWRSTASGPTGGEAVEALPGGISPDHGYSFWAAGSHGAGSLEIEGVVYATYLRFPDGHSELLGQGSLGSEPEARGRLITAGGTHVIFSTPGELSHPLEPGALGPGTVYDRTPDGVTHVVSLLPGDLTPPPHSEPNFLAASADGSSIAFRIGTALYLRLDDAETLEVASEGATFAGISSDGNRVFYLQAGDLFAFDASAKTTTRLTTAGDVTPVNVPAGGGGAYFVSPTVLTGGEANPAGAVAQAGEENLYWSDGTTTRFLATVTARDVQGEVRADGKVDGLGLWTFTFAANGGPARDPSRSTADGSVLVFESRADLTGYDSVGHAEVYRYDAGADRLDCLSCPPTRLPATGDASLQSTMPVQFEPEPFTNFALLPNLVEGGARAFFQTPEPLVPDDTDEVQDVYEWEAAGVGSCTRPRGCVSLITSGKSALANYLYGVSTGGDDVFFTTSDLLVAADTDATPSIYDARVGGGFPQEAVTECEGEACRGSLGPPPPPASPASAAGAAGGNVPPRPCPKGTHLVRKRGKAHCRGKGGKHRGSRPHRHGGKR